MRRMQSAVSRRFNGRTERPSLAPWGFHLGFFGRGTTCAHRLHRVRCVFNLAPHLGQRRLCNRCQNLVRGRVRIGLIPHRVKLLCETSHPSAAVSSTRQSARDWPTGPVLSWQVPPRDQTGKRPWT